MRTKKNYTWMALSTPNGGPTDQVNFLKTQVATGKKIIVLSHHAGLSEDGSATTELWSQVLSTFPAGSAPAFWYWGHFRAGVVYNPFATVNCRCCGARWHTLGAGVDITGKP